MQPRERCSLSRLRGRAGVGVLPQSTRSMWSEPSPAALFERVDLSRERERCRCLWLYALTPTPIGQDTPVPPRPQ